MDLRKLNKNVITLDNRKCVLLLGSTIGNISDNELNEVFHNISNFLNKDDFLVITFDVNHDIPSLLSAYDNYYAKKLVKNSLYNIKNILKLNNLNLDDMEIKCEWDKNDRAIKYYLKSAVHQELNINSVEVKISGNKEFNIVKSKKFLDEEIRQHYLQKGLSYVTSFTNSSKRMKVYILQK